MNHRIWQARSLRILCYLFMAFLLLPGVSYAGGGETFVNREYIRNGGFDLKFDDWGMGGSTGWLEVQDVGAGTDPVLVIKQMGGRGTQYAWQQIYLPTRVTGGSLSFDYRLNTVNPGSVGTFAAGIVTSDGQRTTVLMEWTLLSNVSGDTGWRAFQHILTDQEVAQLQAARDAGKPVYLILQVASNLEYDAYVDNVSLKLSGKWVYPDLPGTLAFGYVTDQRRISIVAMRPDGRDRRTVWTSPNNTGKLYGLAWKPDGTEIAFASTHEFTFSPFQADIYSVRVSDGQVRRLTNPPGHAEIQAGGYGRGTVTGRVYNNFGPVTTFMIYVQGATQPLTTVSPGSRGDTVSFTVSNVADLGPGVGQYIVFIWSGRIDTNGDGVPDKNCATGFSRASALVDVRAGRTVDAGTVQFNGDSACLQYEATSPAWRPDGQHVGFSIDGVPSMVDMNGSLDTPFTTDALSVLQLEWSPRNDGTILYTAYQGLYRTVEGGGRGTLLVSGGNPPYITPERFDWLPDGSGVVFTDGLNLYTYRFSDGQVIQLTQLNLYRHTELIPFGSPVRSVAVSPDGKYVLFERRGPGMLGRTLWMLNLQDITEMWPVTTDGQAQYMDWIGGSSTSRGDRRIYVPYVVR